jgi:hypothetical protein
MSAPIISLNRDYGAAFCTLVNSIRVLINCENRTQHLRQRGDLQAAMSHAPMLVRFLAVVAMMVASGDAAKALPVFKACSKNEGLTQGRDFLGRWWERYLACQPGEDFLQDKKRKGRPPFIDEPTAKKVAKAFKRKIPVHGKRRHYHNVAEVRTWWLACANWRVSMPSAVQHPQPSLPSMHSYMSTAVPLHAGMPEECVPQGPGGRRFVTSLLVA